MRNYALVKNNVVEEVRMLSDAEVSSLGYAYQLIIDLDEYLVSPEVGWILQGNRLVPNSPEGLPPEIVYRGIVKKYREFGVKLSNELVDRIGGRNLILGKTEAQVAALVSALAPIGMLLEKGALKTGRGYINQIKPSYTDYTDILDYAIEEITSLTGP